MTCFKHHDEKHLFLCASPRSLTVNSSRVMLLLFYICWMHKRHMLSHLCMTQFICIIITGLNLSSQRDANFPALGKQNKLQCQMFLILQTVWLQTVVVPPQSPCCPGVLLQGWAHKSVSQLHRYLPAWAQLRRSAMMMYHQYLWIARMVSSSKRSLF